MRLELFLWFTKTRAQTTVHLKDNRSVGNNLSMISTNVQSLL
ncbi:MAG TPA: hypothetical protein VD927_10330 [Chryseosolibacter sp.]|nr:hypothetical protein [Chryseosolibacter sp.]